MSESELTVEKKEEHEQLASCYHENEQEIKRIRRTTSTCHHQQPSISSSSSTTTTTTTTSARPYYKRCNSINSSMISTSLRPRAIWRLWLPLFSLLPLLMPLTPHVALAFSAPPQHQRRRRQQRLEPPHAQGPLYPRRQSCCWSPTSSSSSFSSFSKPKPLEWKQQQPQSTISALFGSPNSNSETYENDDDNNISSNNNNNNNNNSNNSNNNAPGQSPLASRRTVAEASCLLARVLISVLLWIPRKLWLHSKIAALLSNRAASASSSSTTTTHQSMPMPHRQRQHQRWWSKNPLQLRRMQHLATSLRRWVPRVSFWSLTIGLLAWHSLGLTPLPAAYAAPPTVPVVIEQPAATSLRPGMTRSQAQALEQGQVSRQDVLVASSSSSTESAAPSKPKAAQQQKQPKGNDYDEEYDEDYDGDYDDGYDYGASSTTKRAMSSSTPPVMKKKTTLRSGSRQTAPAGVTAAPLLTQSDFANPNQFKVTNAQRAASKFYVSLAVAVPLFGGTVIREQVRRRRESAYVKRGLELQRDQYKEYFNITTTNDDASVEDELKGLKKNTTKSGDDDDDDGDDVDEDDDDDDDDEDDGKPRPSLRRSPRKPPPGGGGGGGTDGSGGAGGDNGGGGGDSNNNNQKDNAPNRMSNDDLDRLNEMFKKS